MNIILNISRDHELKMSLLTDKGVEKSISWKENRDFSRVFLSNLDKILRKNKMGLDKISGYKIISEVPRKWTTYRIAEIILKSLMIAKLAK